ncbi:hypothetical protein WG901_22385 [Novosphingobium sp. PS1R-30]|uniref:Uncharacterized protein n=1 Tax=Novosphingobium anseongense TaxID=3133436 RepID=A0ABU8S2G0_9SPHN|nr:MAG: hypothetical protein EOO76_19510 [Novosphingobium sp.]
MGTVHKFKRPPKNRGQFRGQTGAQTGGPRPPRDPRGGGRRWWQWKWLPPLAVLALAIGLGLLSTWR